MPGDYLWDRSGEPDEDVARLEKLMAPLAFDPAKRPLDELKLKRRKPKLVWPIAGAVVAAAAILAFVLWPRGGDAGPCMAVTGGIESCVAVGATLDTGAREADVKLGSIGVAHLGTATRIRVDATTASAEQKLHLSYGTLHAKVKAPPRLFAITTPSTAVTDLGCEYDIHVDATGHGEIRVLSGKVELAANATGTTIVVAPAGTHATIRPGNRPGLPMLNSASPALVAAIARYEGGEVDGIAAVLAAANDEDAITLVDLATLEPAHPEILTKLISIAPTQVWAATAVGPITPAKLAKWRDDIVDAQIAIDALIDH